MTLNDPNDEDDNDFFERMRERMPAEHQKAGRVLDLVNDVYVETGRDDALRKRFDRFLTYITAKQRHGRRGKGNAFFVTGQSGAGKTDMVEHLLMEHPMMQPFEHNSQLVRPWLRVALQGPATLRALGADILLALGYPVKSSARQSFVWQLLPGQLRFNRVFIIHIDETQHLLANGADTETVASAIKGLMNYMPWPISFILSGKPKVNELILHDDQAERRQFSLPVPAVNAELDDDRPIVDLIIKKLCDAAGLESAALIAGDMPKRISYAANFQFGRTCEVVITAIQIAVLRKEKKLVRDHFVRAYRDHSHTSGDDELNPFFGDDWKHLAPGYFVTRPVAGE